VHVGGCMRADFGLIGLFRSARPHPTLSLEVAMRMLVGTVAVVGALAAGGIPAMALTSGTHHNAALPSTSTSSHTTRTRDTGPPSWAPAWGYRDKAAHDRGHPDKAGHDRADRRDDRAEGSEARTEHGRKMAALARTHANGMRAWASCLHQDAQAAKPGVKGSHSRTCGQRPRPPGHLK
jgi:hypothetical protein